MARYSFSTCSAFPKRLPTADFLLNGGQSMTWLLGNKLITVTTSGCSQKALKNGLCDKCWVQCRQEIDPISPDSILDQDGSTANRRPKMAVQRSIVPLNSKDDPGSNVRLTRQMSEAALPRTSTAATNSPTEDTKKNFNLQETHDPEPTKLDQLLFGSKESEKQEQTFCACWCQGWAEIYVRRPTGDMSWVMRIQNQNQLQGSVFDFPLADITTLFMPKESKKEQQLEDDLPSQKHIGCENHAESDNDAILDQHLEHGLESANPNIVGSAPICIPSSPGSSRQSQDKLDIDEHDLDEGDAGNPEEGGKSRNPVRRSNSSPEMSASWKTAFMNRDKEREALAEAESAGDGESQIDGKKSSKTKDPRVSCEAIPEEMNSLGTTPPTGDGTSSHPCLLSCNSYPGAVAQMVSPPSIGSAIRKTATQSTPPPASQQVSSGRPPQSPSQVRNSGDPSKVRDPKSPTDSRQSFSMDTGAKVAARQQTMAQGTSSLNATNDKAVKEEPARPDPSTLPPLTFKRDRGHTISVMSPVRKPRPDWSALKRDNSPRSKDTPRSGISPSFVFLQLYHTTHFGSITEKPLLVSQSQVVQRAFKNLDRIPPYETHKVGVIYVGPGQANNETEILKNEFGSLRYTEFLQRLGTLIKLKDADPQNTFLGGLERNGNDGKFAYIWQDDVMQVTFHVATLMPTKESDPMCNCKKLHIGNNYVTIVYNESGEEYNVQTLKAQFQYAWVIVQPLDHNTNQVIVKAREELQEHIGHSEPKMVSDHNVAILARQLALHANLASVISCSLKAHGQDPYASNWLERLRQIKRLRQKIVQETGSATNETNELLTSPRSSRRVHMEDFTEYT